jgi:hypothetical protein
VQCVRRAAAVAVVAAGVAAPTIFRTDARGRWHVRRQTHGGVCSDVVPMDLIRAWWLEHWGGRCYVLPSWAPPLRRLRPEVLQPAEPGERRERP